MTRFLKAIHISVLFCMLPSARYVQPYLCKGKTARTCVYRMQGNFDVRKI